MEDELAEKIINAIINAVLEMGGEEDNLRKVIEDRNLASEIAKLVFVPQAYTAIVNYSKTLKQMIAAGRYEYVDDDMTAENFPIDGQGQEEVEYKLVHFNRFVCTHEVLDELKRRGLRAAKLEELLAFGKKYPKIQLSFPIVGLGSVSLDYRFPEVPSLSRVDDERDLSLEQYRQEWWDNYRFLAVCSCKSI